MRGKGSGKGPAQEHKQISINEREEPFSGNGLTNVNEAERNVSPHRSLH